MNPGLQGSKTEKKAEIGFSNRLKAYFLTGIMITAPIGITFYAAWVFIDWVDVVVAGWLPAQYNPNLYLPFSIPGLGLLAVLVTITLIGMLTANFLGRSLVRLGERVVDNMPVVRSVYGALKQIIETVLAQSSTSFRQVVLVEYPRKGLWAIAFVTSDTTGEVQRATERDVINIFLPTTPNPTSGFLLFVPKEDLINLEMSVEEGVKMVISAGLVTPPDHHAIEATQAKLEAEAERLRQQQAAEDSLTGKSPKEDA